MADAAPRISVIVVDDHPVYREGIVRGLVLSGRVEVVAEASTGREALQEIRRRHPRVAVVDYRLPDLDGIAVLHSVIRDALPTRVIILSATADSSVVFRAVQEGAAGYIPKDARRQEIVDAVLKVAAGHVVIAAELTGALAEEIRIRGPQESPILTVRERQVLDAFSRGLSIRQTAAELFLAVSTVKTHTQRMYEKLQVSDRAAAVAEAMRRRLLE